MPRKPYTAGELKILRDLYPNTPSQIIADMLDRKLHNIYGAAKRYGLAKSKEYLDSPAACRLRRGDKVGAGTRFKKGQVPSNKGVKMPGWRPGRMAETQFRKGNTNHNVMPIGATRKIEGYLYRKVSAVPHVAYTVNWKPVHVMLWEEENGKVPSGHVLVFRDRNKDNITLENLELITRGDLAKRNSIHNLPPELRDTIMLKGALNRRIRRLSGKEQD